MGKQILLYPDGKMEAEHIIVDKHGTVTPVILNSKDKVMISPDVKVQSLTAIFLREAYKYCLLLFAL